MDMWIPMKELSVGLDRRDHAGDHAGTVAQRWSATKQASNFGLDALPGATREFTEQCPVETRMDPQAFWDGEDHLPMCDGKTDFFGNVDSC